MRRSSWTPSIVPRGDDHNVYLVMDDLGQQAASGGKQTARPPTLKTPSSTCWKGNIKARFAWSPSTRADH
jgi:hypothetical protein